MPNVTLPNFDNRSESEDIFMFRNSVWLIEFVVTAVVLVITLYLIIAIAFRWLKCGRESSRKHRSRENKLSNTTKKICVVISVLTLLYQILSMGYLLLEKRVANEKPDSSPDYLEIFCHVLPRARVSILIVATGLTYLFLWERQRVFYISPSLKTLNSKFIKVTSYLVFIFWIAYFIPIIIIYCSTVNYELELPVTCRPGRDSLPRYRNIIVSWHIVSVLMQFALLGLFINPLWNRVVILNNNTRRSTKKGRGSKKVSVTGLMNRIRRAVILTIVCLVSDILSGVSVILLYQLNSNNFSFPYNVNLIVNLFATIGCFDNWQMIIWPCTKKEALRRGSNIPKSTSVTPANSISVPSFVPVSNSLNTPSKRQSSKNKNNNSCLPSTCVVFSISDT